MKNSIYENVPCPACNTVHQIKKTDRGRTINCLCDKKLIVIAFDGKYQLVEVQDA